MVEPSPYIVKRRRTIWVYQPYLASNRNTGDQHPKTISSNQAPWHVTLWLKKSRSDAIHTYPLASKQSNQTNQRSQLSNLQNIPPSLSLYSFKPRKRKTASSLYSLNPPKRKTASSLSLYSFKPTIPSHTHSLSLLAQKKKPYEIPYLTGDTTSGNFRWMIRWHTIFNNETNCIIAHKHRMINNNKF